MAFQRSHEVRIFAPLFLWKQDNSFFMFFRMRKCLLLSVLLMMAFMANAQTDALTPQMFGLQKAKTDVDRYYVLYNMHKAARILGREVDYSGIGELNIELPADAQPIPLNNGCDFSGLVLNVTNNNKKGMYLFTLTQPTDTIHISKEQVDSGDFSEISRLDTNTYLLILQDDSSWVDKRQGYSYGHTRKDILVVDHHHAVNQTVMPYNTPGTQLRASICPATHNIKVIAGITINRHAGDSAKTYCFDVQNQFNVELRDITINTPENNFYADAAIRINNSANIRLNRVNINGTYSQTNHYGYGVSMDNVWRSQIVNMKARANWGIFGNNNINEVVLDSCDINRYDIHCYGRDVIMQNCTFSNLYNQFSSVFGKVVFENCVFNNHIPVLLESSYNAYTPFDLYFYNCTFRINSKRNYLVDARDLTNTRNSRPEVGPKNLPNINMSRPTFILTDDVSKLYMFRFSSVSYTGNVGNINRIDVKQISVKGGKVQLKVCNKDFPHKQPINFPLRNQTFGK